jgi:hypothetical protein
MPGCCLPSQTAATVLHFITLYLKPERLPDPDPCFAFSGGNSLLLIESTRAITLLPKKHPAPSISYIAKGKERS